MEYLTLCIIIFCAQGMVGSALVQTDTGIDKDNLSLVHLFRMKRFDFSMFGCGMCHPIVHCRRDSDCASKGSDYSCEIKCCSFVCVQDDDDMPEDKLFGTYRHNEHNWHSRQADETKPADSADEYQTKDDVIDTSDIHVANEHDISTTTELPATDVSDSTQHLAAKEGGDDVTQTITHLNPTQADGLDNVGKP